jgi:hypothetical protein
MQRYKMTWMFLLSLITVSHGWARPLSDKSDYWQCTTMDSEDQQWVATNTYKRAAANIAYSSCKKQSRTPTTCKASKEACEHIINGLTDKPLWQCTALDQLAKPWSSDIYTQRYDAALAAKAYCQENSTVPGTCYINLLTCVNKNPNSRM